MSLRPGYARPLCRAYRAVEGLPGYQGMPAILSKPGIVSMCRTILSRISWFGRGPRKSAVFSASWSGLVVAGKAKVKTGV